MKCMVKKIVAIICCLNIFIMQFSLVSHAVAYPVMGIIVSKTQVYSKAGTTGHEKEADKNKSKKLTDLEVNTSVKVLGTEKDGDGDRWYKIGFGENYKKIGYAVEAKVDLVAEYVEDPEFEEWLTKQEFPESYKDSLRNLHVLYPNWVFYADHIEDSWSTVLSKYKGVDKKLLHGSLDISWKSYEKGAYDWDTKKWLSFDSGDWVTPDNRVVAYHLDPRNFLTTTHIFMFFSQSYNSELDSAENLKTFLKGTFMSGKLPDNDKKTYADVLMAAAKSSKVSPYVLASIIRQEQGTKGTGASISGTVEGYKGYYNYFNIGAFAQGDMTAVQRGLWWAKGTSKNLTSYLRPWNTHEKAIKGGAIYYGESYIAVGQNTLFYKNFNIYKNSQYDLYTHQYATNITDTKTSAEMLGVAYAELYDEKLSFHIPVYKDMPEKTELPTEGTNNDRFLKKIMIGDQEIENFNRYTYEYELIVPFSTDSIVVKGYKSNSGSKVSGNAEYDLEVGDNEIALKVTSSSGLKSTYKLTIHREAEGDETKVEPKLKSTYKIEEYITGVEPLTTVEDFKSKITVTNGTIKVIGNGDKEKETGNIVTGDKVYVYKSDNSLYVSYQIVIYGDTNGDGKINSTDRLRIRKHILKEALLKGVYMLAGDANKDGKVNSTDRLRIRKHILKEKMIEQ